MQSRYKKLINNSFIFAIGDLGSKGITLLLVPFYTFFLSQSEYGLIDIIQVTINLLIPLLSLSVYEAVLRYVMDNRDISGVFTNGFFITVVSSLIILFTTLLLFLFSNQTLIIYSSVLIIIQLFHNLILQFIRALGKIKIFAISGIITAICLGVFNILLIGILKLGIIGYLFAGTMSILVSTLYMNSKVNIIQYINPSKIRKDVIKKLVNYSLPLMPNSIMWWVINASSRYFILIFAGTVFNGLFAVASKIPGIFSIFNSIFFKAWQLSAIEEYNSDEKGKFYSTIFNYYQQFLFLANALALIFIKPIFLIAIDEKFYNAWIYVPFLLVASLFSSFSSFFGANYIAAKKTMGVFRTSVIGGVVNISLNCLLIPFIGVIGASLASLSSFIVITVLRLKDSQKYIEMTYQSKNIFVNLLLSLLIITTLYLELDIYIELVINVLFLLIMLINNRGFLSVFIHKLKVKWIK